MTRWLHNGRLKNICESREKGKYNTVLSVTDLICSFFPVSGPFSKICNVIIFSEHGHLHWPCCLLLLSVLYISKRDNFALVKGQWLCKDKARRGIRKEGGKGLEMLFTCKKLRELEAAGYPVSILLEKNDWNPRLQHVSTKSIVLGPLKFKMLLQIVSKLISWAV